jgi:hypothetical protein
MKESDENYTDPEIINMVREIFNNNISCDPASCEFANIIIKAEKFYTFESNGLVNEWKGNIFLNPPFSMTTKFIDKLIIEFNKNNVKQFIVLVNSYTDPKWFHKMSLISQYVCFTKGRLEFYRKDKTIRGRNRMGQCIFYFGFAKERFYRLFKEKFSIFSLEDNKSINLNTK